MSAKRSSSSIRGDISFHWSAWTLLHRIQLKFIARILATAEAQVDALYKEAIDITDQRAPCRHTGSRANKRPASGPSWRARFGYHIGSLPSLQIRHHQLAYC